MAKTSTCFTATASNALLTATIVGMFSAVFAWEPFFVPLPQAVAHVSKCLFWILIFVVVYLNRVALRLMPPGIILGILASQVFFVFDLPNANSISQNRMLTQYESLCDAVRLNNIDSVNAIVNRDRQLDYVPPARLAANSDQANYYLEQQRPIDIAIDASNLPIAQMLADHGASIGPRGAVGLEVAAKRGDLSVLRFLISHNVLPNGIDGNSVALWNAVREGHADSVEFLLNVGANPNSRTFPDGNQEADSVLNLAKNMNLRQMVLLLRRAGATE